MKHLTTARKFGSKVLVAAGALAMPFAAFAADSAISTAAKSELANTQADATSVGLVIIGIVCTIAVIGIIINMVRSKAK
ncbi:hypothetical protein HZU75_16640 [Chitinibacter fontanus]|uniref:Phage coat protein n=1 Tax=Chitinibacter fontanus TaxID=1737446 RepID=A0A7D5VBJ1_9NEIS|nr:hypothetical protein [Chitinibacter fontanus]QLI83019.1 hypothetical protein HZU75_16640 [Chitinibacter fontanus]